MKQLIVIVSCIAILAGCKEQSKKVAQDDIAALGLKKGKLVSCGPPEKEFGNVGFATGCSEKTKNNFDLGVALLHSFEYDESEKVFAKIIDEEPACAMAYWGVAMSNYHPLWAPPTGAELEKGAKAISLAQKLPKTKTESAYIDALAVFFKDHDKLDHKTRSNSFLAAMEKMYTENTGDKEAAIFYSLILTASADPTDKTYARQKRAVEILKKIYSNQPDHPGIIHYIIHSYDNPELASLALAEARKYASIAPSSAHAQHMPSHIFTRLGLWDECIKSNQDAASSAKCYAESTGIKGHWDEELHAIDYLVYGYLQKADNTAAKKQWEYIKSMKEIHPVNFKVAYALAAVPSRYVLENKLWKEAASLQLHDANVSWKQYPWQNAIYHFAKSLGAARSNQLELAKTELKILQAMQEELVKQKDSYKANQVDIQIKTAAAWIALAEGKKTDAVASMQAAAEQEDKTQKHAVTPGEVLPARELLGEMLLQLNKPAEALVAFEADLQQHQNRLNGLYGAAVAAEQSNDLAKANKYYQQLVSIAGASNTQRSEVQAANNFLAKWKLAKN